jgi:ribosomal subunit interface protein
MLQLAPRSGRFTYVDIVVKGRHTEISERFRLHVAEKLAKIEKLDSKVISVDVECAKERNPRQADLSERVELTIHSRGPVVRAEAAAQDCYAALDVAVGKLEARLRKAQDRRKVHHGRRTPTSVAAATAALDGAQNREPTSLDGSGPDAEIADEGPLVIREKLHAAEPMDLDQALYEMELVGHDFFLFVDAKTSAPSVVYRRRAYDYGVIRLAV